jgi:hypothetical protein
VTTGQHPHNARVCLFPHHQRLATTPGRRRVAVLTDGDIPVQPFNRDRFTRDLFGNEVRDARLAERRVVVFRR